jgi:hypothetical protein
MPMYRFFPVPHHPTIFASLLFRQPCGGGGGGGSTNNNISNALCNENP